jgi:CubicO group peptidase (beta-lactamase class C family)
MTRRRFLAVAGVATGIAGARAAERPLAAQKADLATRFEEASRLMRAQTDSGEVAAAVLHVRRAGQELSRAFGAARVDLPFLLASPTKAMTASAVLWLRDRRELTLTDAVTKFLPDFRGGDRGAVTIHHLLTHTSGLPGMLPENTELRRQHAPLSEFVARTCRTPLLFRAGEKVSYQSMGAHATARDLGTFLEAFTSTDGHVLPKTTAREMRAIQTGTLRPRFGLGWQREPGAFGRTCSAETFGHFGSTGTLIWHDPATATTCVVLTTRPATGSRSSLLLPVSEILGRPSG